MLKRSFEYGGYHFIPERSLTKAENDLYKISRIQCIDKEMGLCKPRYSYESKYPYSHTSFYEASSDKKCDLFRCVENGRLYIPCENDLQIYIEEKTLKKIDDEMEYKELYENLLALPNCNTCRIRELCKFKPYPGQAVRINCPLWVSKQKENHHV